MPRPFTVANAAEMARRSHAARRRTLALRQLALTHPAHINGNHAPPEPEVILARTREQMIRIDAALELAGFDADKLDALTRAKERLFKVYAHLAGIPSPGAYRPTKRERAVQVDIEPLPLPQTSVPPNIDTLPNAS